MRVGHYKLVRDRIPEIIQAEGQRPVTRILDENGYRAALLAKLVEEAQEARAAEAGELAAELLAIATAKRAERGGFGRRLFLEYVEEQPPER
jgi:predicted house-cleaning noncanonical NTP pyrophosphatase (MazG superfamily)